MRTSWLLVGLLAVGCAAPVATKSGATKPEVASRAQPLKKPPVAGVWVSPKQQTANDWQVALLPDGGMTVSGPGLRAHGRYKVENDRTAVGTFEERNGQEPVQEEESKVRFELDPQSKELSFQTGIPGDEDVPVRLVPQSD
jgi:hypothetical protein